MSRMTEDELAFEQLIDQISHQTAEELRQSREFIRSILDDPDMADYVCDLIAFHYPDLSEAIKRRAAGARD